MTDVVEVRLNNSHRRSHVPLGEGLPVVSRQEWVEVPVGNTLVRKLVEAGTVDVRGGDDDEDTVSERSDAADDGDDDLLTDVSEDGDELPPLARVDVDALSYRDKQKYGAQYDDVDGGAKSAELTRQLQAKRSEEMQE